VEVWRSTGAYPLEARQVRILNVGLLDLYQSRGAVSHAPADIRRRVTKRLKSEGHVGLTRTCLVSSGPLPITVRLFT